MLSCYVVLYRWSKKCYRRPLITSIKNSSSFSSHKLFLNYTPSCPELCSYSFPCWTKSWFNGLRLFSCSSVALSSQNRPGEKFSRALWLPQDQEPKITKGSTSIWVLQSVKRCFCKNKMEPRLKATARSTLFSENQTLWQNLPKTKQTFDKKTDNFEKSSFHCWLSLEISVSMFFRDVSIQSFWALNLFKFFKCPSFYTMHWFHCFYEDL